ncbi:Outer membrane protein (Porin) [Cupriavidus taiwanensis]|uniref:porin n=1 Tax=Cupriavidus taiwanensis TaxID=164546 RepID=UPI000E18A83E|nr:porin [Cupriavidus taiwanensis]SOZ99515.1 Outer membrane protein (Porin) [Cupriavidus taiwanensis]
MKRIALTTLLAASAGSACAQAAGTGITLYGRAVAGLDYVNGIARRGGDADILRFGSNQYGVSFWGLRGAEDLGGGLRGVFNLEGMVTSGTGRSEPLFGRRAQVGLAGNDWGALLLGRAMSLTDDESGALDPMGLQASSIATLVYGRNWGSRPNAVTYNSPTWGGLSVRAQAGSDGVAGAFNRGRQLSAAVRYAQASFSLTGIYEALRDDRGRMDNLYVNSRQYTLGGSYALDDLRLFAGYNLTVSSGATAATPENPHAATRSQMAWVGANYRVLPALTLLSGIYYATLNRGGGHGTLLALGAKYDLSKRTSLYGTVASVFNSRNATFSVEASPDTMPRAGANQQGAYAGIIHLF